MILTAEALALRRRMSESNPEKELALDALEKGVEIRSPYLIYLKVDPMFDSLRDDPRFTALLKKVGFEK